MKRKYAFHYPDYEQRENEVWYEKMARKGWHLTKRGTWLSRFEKGEPYMEKYHMEWFPPDQENEAGMDSMDEMNEDLCGWSRLPQKSKTTVPIHIYRIREEDKVFPKQVQEKNKEQVARFLKKRTRSVSWELVFQILTFVLIMVSLYIKIDNRNTGQSLWSTLVAVFYEVYIEETATFIFYCTIIVGCFLTSIENLHHQWVSYRRFCKQKGITDQGGKWLKKKLLYKNTGKVLFCLIILGTGILSIQQKMGVQIEPLSLESEEPYITFSDMDIIGDRIPNMLNQKKSIMIRTKSLIVQQWKTKEFLHVSGSNNLLSQHVYQLKTNKQARKLAQMLNRVKNEDKMVYAKNRFVYVIQYNGNMNLDWEKVIQLLRERRNQYD